MVRTAVIGVGYLGRFHAQKHKALAEQGLCQFVGLYDASEARAEEIAKELGVKAFSKVDDLLAEVDAVTIATTTQTHFSIAKQALSRGIHINVEKPMTVTATEADELLRLGAEKKCVIGVGHSERYNPIFQKLKNTHPSPEFLEFRRHAPFKLRGSDVSVILDLMIHDLDMALNWLGPLEMVSATGGRTHSMTLDYADCELRSSNGAVVRISASRVARAMSRSLRGVQGSRSFAGDFQTMECEETLWRRGQEEPETRDISVLGKEDHLLLETKAFLKAIEGDNTDLVSGAQGAQALKLALLIESEIEAR